MKTNTLLARVEKKAASFNQMLADYCFFFQKKQGAFEGIKKTFLARDGYSEDSSYMGSTKVVTTVEEKLDWMEENAKDYFNELFAVEATNSKGAATIELKVGDVSFGFLTALDLMRLKSLLTKKELVEMYANIPVRSDAEVWETCSDEEYKGRDVFQTPMVRGVKRTSESEEVILKDPNLDPTKLPANYNAKVTVKKRTAETGDYTLQKFTGAWTQRKRAELLRKKSLLLEAVITALKELNSIESSTSNLDVNALFDFLHK